MQLDFTKVITLNAMRSAALIAGMAVLQFSARNLLDSAARQAIVTGFSAEQP